MRRRNSFFCVVAFLTITSLSLAQAGGQKNNAGAPAPSTSGGHHVVTPDKVEWTHPPFVPHGASLAVIAGDPSKAGDLYTIRIKSIAGLKVPPHSGR